MCGVCSCPEATCPHYKKFEFLDCCINWYKPPSIDQTLIHVPFFTAARKYVVSDFLHLKIASDFFIAKIK